MAFRTNKCNACAGRGALEPSLAGRSAPLTSELQTLALRVTGQPRARAKPALLPAPSLPFPAFPSPSARGSSPHPSPRPGQCCWGLGFSAAVVPATEVAAPLPIGLGTAGAEPHWENLLLAVADALETTLLTRLIAKCELIVCTGH